MRCDEARADLLAGTPTEATKAHLAGCRECRSQQSILERVRAELATPAIWEAPSADLDARITRSMQAEQPTSGRGRAPAWAAAAAIVAVLAVAGAALQLTREAPDWTIDLNAIEPGPLTAVVEGWSTAAGTRMVLLVEGLEPAPAGHYYEIWMTAPDGRHVSAGTFQGSGRVTASAGVRRSEFPRIWITLEEVGGDLGPSPETYFDMP